MLHKKKQLAILASGNGTNAQQICEYFSGNNQIEVTCIIYNRPDAFVAKRAEALGIESVYMNRADFYENGNVLAYLLNKHIDWVILAGFLWLIPETLIARFPKHIINIHPALLPKYGGKGMYGHHVHEAVIANHESESGITIHLIDNQYDKGSILFQAKCALTSDDTPHSLEEKIHQLEKEHFPTVIEKTVLA